LCALPAIIGLFLASMVATSFSSWSTTIEHMARANYIPTSCRYISIDKGLPWVSGTKEGKS
jgi:hypothetical protein